MICYEINRKQLINMITNRNEWCISRQRVWGVPIPIIFDENKNPIMDVELIQHTIDLIRENGTNSWYEKPVEFFLTEKYKNSGKQFTKEKDIMDVWFDSGSSYNVLNDHNLPLPADLYLEGVDQYRGWFNSSLICSVIQNKSAPYKRLISHGFTLDEQGRKMSKSIGNVIDPLNVCNEFGADILRMWVASSNYQEDVRISKNILTQISEMYRRIRNTIFKFILSNLSDFEYQTNKCFDFDLADAYVLNEISNDIKKVITAYDKYDFAAVLRIINLETIKLSSWYFDIIKDSLYCDEPNNKNRRAIQTVLYTILNFCISRMLFEKYNKAKEGDLSKKKMFLISGKTCESISYDIKLYKLVKYLSSSALSPKSIFADAVEAILSVIYYEYGIEKTYNIVCELFSRYDDKDASDPKMKLQEICQKKYKCLPVYNVIEKEGTEHNPIFKVEVKINRFSAIGSGGSKKEAEEDGARDMLKTYFNK